MSAHDSITLLQLEALALGALDPSRRRTVEAAVERDPALQQLLQEVRQRQAQEQPFEAGPGLTVLSGADRELLNAQINHLENLPNWKGEEAQDALRKGVISNLRDLLTRAQDAQDALLRPARAKAPTKNRWQGEADWRGGGKRQGDRIRLEVTAADLDEAVRLMSDRAAKRGGGFVVDRESIRVIR